MQSIWLSRQSLRVEKVVEILAKVVRYPRDKYYKLWIWVNVLPDKQRGSSTNEGTQKHGKLLMASRKEVEIISMASRGFDLPPSLFTAD